MSLKSIIKTTVKNTPPLLFIKNKVFDFIRREYWHEAKISENLKLFAPFSGNPPSLVTKLTFLSANDTFPLLVKMMGELGQKTLLPVEDAEKFLATPDSMTRAKKLGDLFLSYGSDKSKTHNYHHVYGAIFSQPEKITKILEIGMGTNNTDIVSNMGVNGKPGASLRSFRDFFKNAEVFGADYDRRILFQEERIKTFFVDQTKLESFKDLGDQVGTGFDLIIDDALHAPNANIAVILFAMRNLKSEGWLMIEDIREEALPLWQVVPHLLPKEWRYCLISAKGAFVFAIQKS